MAVVPVWQDPITGKTGYTALSSDTLPHCAAGSKAYIQDKPGHIEVYDGEKWNPASDQRHHRFVIETLPEELEPVAVFRTQDIERLGVRIKVEDAALDQFQVDVQYDRMGEWVSLALVNGDYTTPNYPVLNSNITNIAAITVGTYYLDLDVSAYHRVMIRAASASASGSKLTIASGDNKPLPYRIKNLVPGTWCEPVSLAATGTTAGGATITGAFADGEVSYTFAGTNLVSGRAFLSHSQNLVKNNLYCLAFYVTDLTNIAGLASPTVNFAYANAVTASEGDTTINHSELALGWNMIQFRPNADVTGALIRIGLYAGGVANCTGTVSITVKNVMFFEVPHYGIGKFPSNFVPYGTTGYYAADRSMDYEPSSEAATVESNYSADVDDDMVWMILTDSFGTGSNTFAYLLETASPFFINTNARAGRGLETVSADIATILVDPPVLRDSVRADGVTEVWYTKPGSVKPKGLIIKGAINTLNLGSATSNPVPTAKTALVAIIAAARAYGFTKFVILNDSPWGGHVSYSLINLDQMWLDTWNAWLKEYCRLNGFGYGDIYTALEDKTKADFLASSAARTGTHNGAANAAVLTDTTASFVPNALIGLTITNSTDGSSGTVTANTATTVTATLAGGVDNDWDVGDSYSIPSNDYDNDGLHPNDAGYKVAKRIALEEVMKVI